MSEDISLNPQQLQTTDIFSTLPITVIQALLDKSTPQYLSDNDIIFRSGDNYKQAIYIVYQGTIARHENTGQIKDIDNGGILGLSNYLDHSPYSVTATAKTKTTLLCINHSDLQHLELDHPTLANLFNTLIAQRIKKHSIASHAVAGPLSHLVRSVMKSPIITCSTNTTLGQAFQIMDERKIGALGVINNNNSLFGVLTYAGIAEAFVSNKATPDSQISIAACDVPRTIIPNAPLWQANEIFEQFSTKYLVVTEDEQPIGLLSQTDITTSLLSEKSGLLKKIKTANSFTELNDIYNNLVEDAQQFHATNHLAHQAVKLLSNVHLAIQHRVIQITLSSIEKQYGAAPRAYALFIMGSGSRKEMLLNPDQDNGIIISDAMSDLTNKEKEWFKLFTDKVNINLDQAGYILCPGDIMARNPLYHKTLKQWKKQITHLIEKPNSKAARWANIVFDFNLIYGDDDLINALNKHLMLSIKAQPKLLEYMVEDDAQGRPALGLFNQLVTNEQGEHKGSIDIKRNGLRIIADAARIYALAEGITERNTLDRLNALVHCGRLSPELVESVRYAYEELLDMLFLHQIEQVKQGNSPDKLIYPEKISSESKSALRVSMRAIKRLQDQLQGEYGRSAF